MQKLEWDDRRFRWIPVAEWMNTNWENAFSQAMALHHQRFEHAYDTHGNWTECVSWNWDKSKAEYVEASIERRRIQYFT